MRITFQSPFVNNVYSVSSIELLVICRPSTTLLGYMTNAGDQFELTDNACTFVDLNLNSAGDITATLKFLSTPKGNVLKSILNDGILPKYKLICTGIQEKSHISYLSEIRPIGVVISP